jgi:hypothetical protein
LKEKKMFLEFSSFKEKLDRERIRRNPKLYDVGKIYAVGGDNRIIGKKMTRDKALGRDVRMDLTSSRPHVKREAHPEAAAASQIDATASSRWNLKSKYSIITYITPVLSTNTTFFKKYNSSYI